MIDAIYARQSIDKKDSISIETQIDDCKKESDGNSNIYIDKGYSGKNTQRPELERLIEDIKKKLIKRVIVYKIDRFSRSILDFANLIKILEEYKVEFVSVNEKFDTSTPIGKAMLFIVMVFAQLERETTAERITDNYYARGKKGLFLGGNTPYGFVGERTEVEGKKQSVLSPNKDVMSTVLEMFDMYFNSNCSLADIQRYLNDNEVKSPQGVNWDTIKINRILRNPVYVKADADVYSYFSTKGCIIYNDLNQFVGEKGCLLIGKRDKGAGKYRDITDHLLTIGQHEGIVDSNVWLSCQYKLDGNKQIKNSGKGKHTWLSGLTKCGYCGYAMTVYTSKVKYFNCRGKINYKVCDVKQTHRVDDVETYVEQEIFKKAQSINKVEIENTKGDSREINNLKLKILDIDRQIGNLVDSLQESNKASKKYINNRISDLDKEKGVILKEVNSLSNDSMNSDKIFEIAKKINNWDKFDLEEKKNIAYMFISKVNISKDKIKIEWKI